MIASQYGGGSTPQGKAQILLRAPAAYLDALKFSFSISAGDVVAAVDRLLYGGSGADIVDLGPTLDNANNDSACNFLLVGPQWRLARRPQQPAHHEPVGS